MTLSPTGVHETLDERGLLEMAHGSGTYALKCYVPATADAVEAAFADVVDATPPAHVVERLADAERVAYVGASGDVYDRLQDHADGDVRQATFLQAFEPVDIVGVWPTPTPFEAEFNRARLLSDAKDWTCWTDGEVV